MNAFTLRDKLHYQSEKMAKVDLVATPRMIAGLNCFEPGQVQKVHAHAGSDKLYIVVEGSGEFLVGAEKRVLKTGDLLHVPESIEHGVVNTGAGRLAVMIVIAPNLHHK
jgi:quercetin dioxygenase-like cupin family protein